ncbi:M20/M25/M40 family metallo-hydrolase [Planococcus glaciei]|uniref:M20/M25/M40 family metallo-hydrolase n=1 Tax=Planococcus glaciei TaxID=459472 RepID=A0A7H8Q6N8_9BACL|nr:M20/M25/M40 family metallo-hydrolase [Planococcus glaciei]ETP67780.1 amino acid degradation protein [Planococcus glaciei CHR43]QDY44869.1 M20/M25/M40 family metallo-hydrolase [Planococcus glaciei]QKX49587.1 M20/M25/M40 family metallo-hydrolase [Planococcus glaciei]
MTAYWGTPEKLQELLIELVSWKSMTLTDGEVQFAYKLKEKMEMLPYFQEHPERLSLSEVNWGRENLTALYKHPEAAETIVLISHYDTVHTSEYGDLEPLACSPLELAEAFKKVQDELDPEAQADLQSGEYLFGRGTMDMKAGLALHMALIEKAAAEEWPINLLLVTVADEEVNSAGMRYGVSKLLDLEREFGLEYILFLNGEPVFAQYPGDMAHYIYTGSIGKIMPSALFYGKETHVGEPLSGITSSYISTYLTHRMEWNTSFRETVYGETTPLPVTLMQRDMKLEYSAQTPYRTSAMYNVFLMEKTAEEVFDQFEKVAIEAMEHCTRDYLAMCERENIEPLGEIRVLRFEELMKYAINKFGIDYVNAALYDTMMHPEWDVRDKSMRIVDILLINCQELTPATVLLYAPPYYPAVNSSEDELVKRCLQQVTANAEEKFGLKLQQIHYFNGISDLSYVNYTDQNGGWMTYEKNTPVYGDQYSIPFQAMKHLKAPVFNVGPFGKDAHKRTERLHIKNTFEKMPILLEEMILSIAVKSAINE